MTYTTRRALFTPTSELLPTFIPRQNNSYFLSSCAWIGWTYFALSMASRRLLGVRIPLSFHEGKFTKGHDARLWMSTKIDERVHVFKCNVRLSTLYAVPTIAFRMRTKFRSTMLVLMRHIRVSVGAFAEFPENTNDRENNLIYKTTKALWEFWCKTMLALGLLSEYPCVR